MAVLFELGNRVNTGEKHLAGQLKALGGVLGLLQRDTAEFFQGKAEQWIIEKIAEREAARKRKDYAAADRIRKELLESKIVVEDKGGKTTWRRS
jgi:cysteinyl-tRNA synthetase